MSNKCARGTKIYLSNNHHDRRKVFTSKSRFEVRTQSRPVWHASLLVRDRAAVKSLVLARAGARPGNRDAVDSRIIGDVLTGAGGVIDSQKEVGGWPEESPVHRKLLMPEDPHADPDGNGYSRIEEFIHQMARDLEN